MKTTEWTDPIVDEIHAIRTEIAKEMNYDVHVYFTRLREAEAKHPERIVSRPERSEK